MLRSCILVCALAGSGTALAQPSLTEPTPAPAMPDDPATAPGFVTLDRGDATSRFGVEASYESLSDDAPYSGAWRFEGHAQYVDPTSGFGGYLLFPFSHYEGSTGAGDLEVGGLYVPKRVAHGFRFVLRAGLTLPTGSGPDNNGNLAGVYSAGTRLTDTYLAIPGGTSLRFAVSALWRSGVAFARADLGVDWNFAIQSSQDGSSSSPADAFVRANAGIGVELGRLSLTTEATALWDPGGQISDSNTLATVALAARARTGPVDLYAAFVAPLGQDARDYLAGSSCQGGPYFSGALTLGVEGRLK